MPIEDFCNIFKNITILQPQASTKVFHNDTESFSWQHNGWVDSNFDLGPQLSMIKATSQHNLSAKKCPAPIFPKSNKRKIIINGREFGSLESAARMFGKSRNTVDYRLSKGWTSEQAVGLEPRPSHAGRTPGVPVKVQGQEFKTVKEAAKYYGRAYTHAIERLKAGCTIEQALGLVKRIDTFKSEYPDIAKQWHPTKNAPLTAEDVSYGSGQKVWWLCSQGHEWKAAINSRRKHGCPFCARQKPTGDRNFAIKYPELLTEWDGEKNSPNKPEDFTPRANIKVWWKCEKGHSWQATICNRTREKGGRCPYCRNLKLCEDNSLAQVRPDIAKDWHPYKNAPLTPNDVLAGGTKRIWWICKHGHEWQTSVGLRVIAGTGCPKCTNQTSRIEIAVYSELCALFSDVEWREKIARWECDILLSNRKIGIEIDGVYWHSRKPDLELAKSAAFEAAGIQLFRLREKGLPLLSEHDIYFKSSEDKFLVVSRLVSSLLKHAELSDQQRVKLRDYIKESGLINEKLYRKLVANLPAPPPGQSLADKYPDIAAQWAYDLNAPLSPEHFRPQANKKVWWRCENYHIWKTTLNIRVGQGTGCPACPRQVIAAPEENNLAVLNPSLASEWHPEKNGDLRPVDIWPNSNRKIWWQCSKGHEWQAVVASRAAGCGCPYCYGRYATKTNNLVNKYPELLDEWDREKNKGLNPSNFTPHVNKKVWWSCRKGHSWQATIYNRTKNKSGCPVCAQNASRKYSIENIQAIAKKRGGKCLSDKFTSCRAKIKL